MADEKMGRKVTVWEIVVLVELVAIIFLALNLNSLNTKILAQNSYVANIEKVLADKEMKQKDLSDKLSSAMGILQNAMNAISQEKQATAINNIVPPEAVAVPVPPAVEIPAQPDIETEAETPTEQ